MARYIGAVCKLCRREGGKLYLKGERCFSEKCAVGRRPYPPGQHGQARIKLSEYGLRLREKQKMRRIYGLLAVGWDGSHGQWRHYRRAYGLLAALATPLVLSVHSVVSWDFAMALVPGWHSTLFAPFFVNGAILSGFAMVLVLVLPMRRAFRLDAYVTDRHLDALAKLLLLTSLILTYFYVCDSFTAWYSGDVAERASIVWRATGTYGPLLALQYVCNSLVPLVLFSGRARRSPVVLFVVSVFVLIGMWLERFNIIVPSLGHAFEPFAFGIYLPALVDSAITIGSFGFFFLLFLGFIKLMPSMSIVEVKETLSPP